MNRLHVWCVVLVLLTVFGIRCYSQDTAQTGPKDKTQAESGSVRMKKAKTVKSRGHRAFTGIVMRVDTDAKTILVKGRGKAVAFDISNPTLKGFRGLRDIRKGNYVSVVYTAHGIRIARSSRSEAGPERDEVVRGTAKRGGSGSGRVRVKTKGEDFCDIDENKDGKVSAVELSAVVKNLNMQEFKEYDKDGDGYLNAKEYGFINR